MPYRVEPHEEINTLISYISPQRPTEEDIKLYLDEVIRFQNRMTQNNAARFYHVLVIEADRYNLTDGLQIIRIIRQNKELHASRKHLSTMTLLVGKTSKSLQIMLTMMTPSTLGRQIAVFATLETALDFIRIDNTNYQHNPVESGPLDLG